jgi:hypothetical protein
LALIVLPMPMPMPVMLLLRQAVIGTLLHTRSAPSWCMHAVAVQASWVVATSAMQVLMRNCTLGSPPLLSSADGDATAAALLRYLLDSAAAVGACF